MKKTKILLTVIAMVLICVVSVMGTMAFLKAETTTSVTNTFTASNTDDFVEKFTIQEYQVTQNNDGSYTESDSATTTSNTYSVLPGTTLPKHPFVTVKRTSTAPAYLFIEVVEGLDEAAYTWNIDSQWAEVTGATPVHENGKVYVLGTAADPTVLNAVATAANYDILADDQITVSSSATAAQIGKGVQMSFYAYLAQATVNSSSTPADVFNTCFSTASGN